MQRWIHRGVLWGIICALELERQKEEERLPDHPLAALGPVVDRGVEEVAAEVHRVDDRLAVAPIDGVVLVAEIGPEADR